MVKCFFQEMKWMKKIHNLFRKTFEYNVSYKNVNSHYTVSLFILNNELYRFNLFVLSIQCDKCLFPRQKNGYPSRILYVVKHTCGKKKILFQTPMHLFFMPDGFLLLNEKTICIGFWSNISSLLISCFVLYFYRKLRIIISC